jgi:hypothetical protein
LGKLLRKIADFIIKHIGQVFFVLLLLWIGMSIFLIIRWYFHKPPEVVDKPTQHKIFTPPESEEEAKKKLKELIRIIKEPEPMEFYTALWGKGLFHEKDEEVLPKPKPGLEDVPSGPELEVIRITPVRIPLKYLGFIELPNGGLSAQMDSSIVSKGDIIMGYKIMEITKEYVKAEKPGGGEIIFNRNEEVVSEESEAVIKDKKSGQVFRVKKGDMIGKKKVSDIKIDSVILLNEDGVEEALPLKRR